MYTHFIMYMRLYVYIFYIHTHKHTDIFLLINQGRILFPPATKTGNTNFMSKQGHGYNDHLSCTFI